MHVFISYSRGTPYIAESIKTILESEGYAVWLDLDDIPGGGIWEQKILDAVEKSFAFIVVLTKQAIGSEWILREIGIAKQQGRNIIPLITERMDDLDAALEQLDIAEFQGIDFVTQRKKDAEEKLLAAIKSNHQKWSSVIPFVQKLKSDNKDEQIWGMGQLAKIEDRATGVGSYIHPFLKSPDWEVRWKAVWVLGEVGNEDDVEPLIEMINEGFSHPLYEMPYDAIKNNVPLDVIQTGWSISHTVDWAIIALGWIGSLKAAPFLRKEAKKKNALAITSLGYIQDKASAAIIAEVLDHSWRDDLITEFACIWALGRIGAKEAARSINGWLRKYLPIIDSEEIEYYEVVKGTFEDNAYELWEILNIPHRSAEYFIYDRRINVVSVAMIVLGLLQDRAFADTLIEILVRTETNEEPYALELPSIHCIAALALGLLGSEKALPELSRLKSSYDDKPSNTKSWEFYPVDFVSEAIQMIEGSHTKT